ncbi:MAG: tRNA pseudouridine(55) synthase TruB, partial [Thermomicrobiaceae bacterium]|nr:tRNA pseudouridine(55) synthase TruB [Thermomicrobiaceae bacterium]
GVLVLAVGSATRLIDLVQGGDKQYLAHVVLGVQSESADVEGAATAVEPERRPERPEVEAALQRFLGETLQVPPAYSAIKVGGEALYRRARRGEEVEVPAREVVTYRLALVDYRYPDALVAIDCGKGFYVRSLARDLGQALGTGAYLHALLRTRVGPFDLPRAWPLATLEASLTPETWSLFALHPDAALADHAALALDARAIQAWYHGRPVRRVATTRAPEPLARAYSEDGAWVGLAALDAAGVSWLPRQVLARQ